MPVGVNEQPWAAIFDETEQSYRDNPLDDFTFLPVGLNAVKQGQLVCFRKAANLPMEAAKGIESGVHGIHAWHGVVWLDRQCQKWCQWEPGVGPREQFAEERSRKFMLDLKGIETRLTMLAIKVAVVIGLVQLLLMTPDSVGCKLLARMWPSVCLF